ncbi:rhomboid family intramembrane serine protease [Mitsuaria sp. GD03876]|uniref:rhomboid family intramembrane serine protease n=1 Tax=Mitsuaria sp. GD03876 TaxID=2975399 RepID=UPI00244B5C91|nr:rhomboid family intramembrane serine protease [Mitsuaria sp. GD03876]MDH0865020.1 rhomboid family intramembrane serine protease [Mitsuaria sp. GD03876]
MPTIPPVTKALMLFCVGLFCLLSLIPGGQAVITLLALWPLNSGYFELWQPVTYTFLHGDALHLFFNMLGLWMFGSELEVIYGRNRYLLLLLASTLTGAAAQLVFTLITGSFAPTVGASGALFGLLLAYGLRFPDRIIMPLFPPIPMKAKFFVAIFGAIELVLGFTGSGGIAHFAHLGGMLGAWLMINHWRSGPRR